MIKKLVVFPNDSLLDYFKKGEIKNRYFNPQNWFDEIHVISLFHKEIEAEKVKKLSGSGKLIIHHLGKVNLSNYKSNEQKIFDIISDINPLLIRSFNPRIQGWLATKIGKNLNIPTVISLHTNYEQQTQLAKKERSFFQFLKLKYSSNKLEKFALKNCDNVICVYEFIVPYAQKMGASNIQVIYNKVDLSKFSPSATKKLILKKPLIISVGRLIEQKNRRNLIEAFKNIDAELMIVGDGPQLDEFKQLIKILDIGEKVKIIKKIPNEELPGYYVSADIFALPMENLDGVPIPFLEAMACGLPVVTTKHSNSYSEITDEAIVFVENDPKNISEAINKILEEPDYRNKLISKSLDIAKMIGGEIMEEQELELYKNLLKKFNINNL